MDAQLQAQTIQYKITLQFLRSNERTIENLNRMIEETAEATIHLIASSVPKTALIACEAGCNHCCYLMATVSGPEALSIASRMKEEFSSDELAVLGQAFRNAYKKTKVLDNLSRAKARIACPLLDESGLCKIYDFRPLDCITHHSLDKNVCHQLLDDPEINLPKNDVMRDIGVGIKTGLGLGIAEINLEAPAFRYELIEAILICLEDDSAVNRYIAGERIFESATIVPEEKTKLIYKLRGAPPRLRSLYRSVVNPRKKRRIKRKK